MKNRFDLRHRCLMFLLRFKEIVSSVVLTLLNCTGLPLISFKATGNSTQASTPAPDAPIDILSTGDLVTSSDADWESAIAYGTTAFVAETPKSLSEETPPVDCYRVPIRVKSPNLPPIKEATIKAINTVGTWTGDTYTLNGLTYLCVFDGNGDLLSVTVNGTSTNYTWLYLVTSNYSALSAYNLIAGQSYKLFGCPSGGSNDVRLILDYTPSGSVSDTGSGASFTADGTKTTRLGIYVSTGITVDNKTFTPAIYDSANAALPFQPYHTPYIYNIYLDAPLRYGDVLELNGTLTRKSRTKAFLGTETWDNQGGIHDATNTMFFAHAGLTDRKAGYASFANVPGKNTHFINPAQNIQTALYDNEAAIGHWDAQYRNYYYIRINKARLTAETAEGFKTWLAAQNTAGTPVTTWYNLETPTTETVTMPDNMETFKGTTMIQLDTVTQPSVMEAEYWSTEETE